jgi:hypothetical protein
MAAPLKNFLDKELAGKVIEDFVRGEKSSAQSYWDTWLWARVRITHNSS